MVRWAVLFLVIAVASGLAGYRYMEGEPAELAQFVCIVSGILCATALIIGGLRGRKDDSTPPRG